MSANDRISRLESLLARVQQRANEPRRTSQVSPKATTGAMAAMKVEAANGGAPAISEPPPPPKPSVQPPTPAMPRVSEPPEAAFPSEPPVASRPSTVPPMTSVDDDYAYTGDSSDADVEVSSEVVDIDVDVDVDDTGMPLESGAQPVADHASLPPDDGGGIGETTMADAQHPVLGPENEAHSEHEHEHEAAAAQQTPANEIEEPAPSSSPRPIASEKPEAFEEESAPRHTPPPESGKQVAAAPSTPPRKQTSAPPPSIEGHTLIGGWREPGLGGPAIGASGSPQVRVPAPVSPGGPAKEVPGEPVTATRSSLPPRHSDRPLSPEITRAELTSTTKVAAFNSAPPTFKPSTFGDLLDASLDL